MDQIIDGANLVICDTVSNKGWIRSFFCANLVIRDTVLNKRDDGHIYKLSLVWCRPFVAVGSAILSFPKSPSHWPSCSSCCRRIWLLVTAPYRSASVFLWCMGPRRMPILNLLLNLIRAQLFAWRESILDSAHQGYEGRCIAVSFSTRSAEIAWIWLMAEVLYLLYLYCINATKILWLKFMRTTIKARSVIVKIIFWNRALKRKKV